MVRAEESIVVGRPIDEVFEYLTDPNHATEWLANLVFVSLDSPGVLREGSRLVEVRKLLGREVESTVEVVEFDPPRRYVTEVVSGSVPHRIETTLSAANGGTRVDRVVEGEPGDFFGVPEDRAIKAVRREIWNGLATLRDILESRSE